MAQLRCFRIFLGAEDALRHSLAVTNVDKDHSTLIANRINPAGQRNNFTGMRFSDFVAMMSSVHEISQGE
jgi:hypothetical protein